MYLLKCNRRYENELKLIPDDDIEGFEIWLKNATNYFHSNHYLILGVKYTLCLLYGKINGFMIQELNEDLLKRKIALCQDLLKVADIIEPGLSRLRGNYNIWFTFRLIFCNKFLIICKINRNFTIRVTRASYDVNNTQVQDSDCF